MDVELEWRNDGVLLASIVVFSLTILHKIKDNQKNNPKLVRIMEKIAFFTYLLKIHQTKTAFYILL